MFKVPHILLSAPEAHFGRDIEQLMFNFPDSLLQTLNPRTKWRVETDATGKGRVAYAVLEYDKDTERVVVFGAVERGTVKTHQHIRKIGGSNGDECEDVLTLAGQGFDILDSTGEPIVLERGVINSHTINSVHAPGSDEFWSFIYRNYGVRDLKEKELQALKRVKTNPFAAELAGYAAGNRPLVR